MAKQSSKVHFTVQKRTWLLDNTTFKVYRQPYKYQVSAPLIFKTAKTFLVAEAVSWRGTSKVAYNALGQAISKRLIRAIDQHMTVNLETKKKRVVRMHSHLVRVQGLVFCPDTQGWSELQALWDTDVCNVNQEPRGQQLSHQNTRRKSSRYGFLKGY